LECYIILDKNIIEILKIIILDKKINIIKVLKITVLLKYSYKNLIGMLKITILDKIFL